MSDKPNYFSLAPLMENPAIGRELVEWIKGHTCFNCGFMKPGGLNLGVQYFCSQKCWREFRKANKGASIRVSGDGNPKGSNTENDSRPGPQDSTESGVPGSNDQAEGSVRTGPNGDGSGGIA